LIWKKLHEIIKWFIYLQICRNNIKETGNEKYSWIYKRWNDAIMNGFVIIKEVDKACRKISIN
jgi:hypothetical protein